jgi:hypothetical protein
MKMTEYTLLKDVTAADLAMDSTEPGEGYPPDYIIGSEGHDGSADARLRSTWGHSRGRVDRS